MKQIIIVLTLILFIFLTGCENYDPQVHPEEFDVTITFEDISITADNETLYNQVSEGDKIQVFLYHGYNEKHELAKKTLLFPE